MSPEGKVTVAGKFSSSYPNVVVPDCTSIVARRFAVS
jgi:hypothetical protein